ncbi:2OG-Fe(II) oxygenase [Calothrix sp. NIES-4101]|nr:2OG-Fe(II) oxygenase [Calothrix sp. NIES-4101]
MLQLSLFSEAAANPWSYISDFLPRDKADKLYEYCKTLKWEQNRSSRFAVPNPRLECMYGGKGYEYSGITLQSNRWTAELYNLASEIVERTGYSFHCCIGNLYRDGNDSIGWHADKDLSMGENPAIASLSLGQMRLFQIKSNQKDAKIQQIWLEHGSLLIMHPGMQSTHVHRVPKVTRGWCGERINLTFRPSTK